MQEPILTRWGTVGSAVCYTNSYHDVLDVFYKGICGSKSRKASHSAHQCASNFRSLCREKEIVLDCAFLADFNHSFFRGHFDFNHATDPFIRTSGFLGRHHLVRTYIKETELKQIQQELKEGIVERPPTDDQGRHCVLKGFWPKLWDAETTSETKTKVLYKAQVFIDGYVKSFHKHHAQWMSPSLLFLGAFGEFETGQIVARLLSGKEIIFDRNDDANNNKQFKPALHEGTIDLELFATWLKEILIGSVVEEAVSSPNVDEVMEAIEAIADGMNIWDEKNLVGQIYREEFLENFAAIPSTMEMVERSVKKAKFCQQTGKGERSVSAYGIAGDGVSERCQSQFVVSDYKEEMVK
jgi:hypothetical protein